MSETDQEQTERGASTVDRVQATSDRLYKADFFGRLYLADYVADVQTLCADLERVMAELAETRAANEAQRQMLGTELQKASMVITDLIIERQDLEAERDAMREVVDLTREYMDALRREQREVLGDDDAEVEGMLDAMCGDDEGSRDVQVKRRALIARLDATRKATADATEEG